MSTPAVRPCGPATSNRLLGALTVLLLLLVSIPFAHARDVAYVYGTGVDGVTRQLAVDRQPALFTRDFGDCLGGQSLFNITKYDAAYYTDNSTVLFHLDGTSNIRNESLMMYIELEAYGEKRFSMAFDPCSVNIYSLCPLNASNPIEAWAFFTVGAAQVGDITPLAFSIPDFEGTIRMQIFANSSRTEIGCFQASVSNGNSFSHPDAIAPVLGVFTVTAIVASFATAAYGVSVPHMRTHYAHSLSVLVVFETLQSFFFSGAISVNLPSALVAWWSNFAWAAGMIPSSSVIRSIDSFTGVAGNASQVGGAGSTIINNGGGLAAQIYGRSLAQQVSGEVKRATTTAHVYNESDPFDYNWAGDPVAPGVALPGEWKGFSGTLTGVGIPTVDAFIMGLIWFLVALGLVAVLLVTLKFALEALARFKLIKRDRLAYFRSHWVSYTVLAVLRTFFIGFSPMMTLAIYQFTIKGAPGATAIAAVVFVLFLVGLGGLAVHACRTRLRHGHYVVESDRLIFHRGTVFKVIPCLTPILSSTLKEHELAVRPLGSISWFRIRYIDNDPSRTTVHQDQTYIKRFGWLSARYRRTRWWFFVVYLGYQLIRAAFIGGAGPSPLAQVYGLFVYDIIAMIVLIKLNPFEGQRNTALGTWMLSICKVVTSGLTIAFLPAFGLNRIIATVLGIIIIIAQGLVLIAMLILIAMGTISSYMSLTRNREDFRPREWEDIRLRYFEAMIKRAPDVPLPPKEKPKKKKSDNAKGKEPEETPEEPQVPREPYFSVTSVRRAPKIEDEDEDVLADMEAPHNNSVIFDPNRIVNRSSRTNSMASRYSTHSLPRGARIHRTSWSSRDFAHWDALQKDRPNSSAANRFSIANIPVVGGHQQQDSSNSATTDTPLVQPQASQTSLRISTAGDSKPSGPTSPPSSTTPVTPTGRVATPTRELLDKHAEERSQNPPAP